VLDEPVLDPVVADPVLEPVVVDPVVLEPLVAEPVVLAPLVPEPAAPVPPDADPVALVPPALPVLLAPLVVEPVVLDPVVLDPPVPVPVLPAPVPVALPLLGGKADWLEPEPPSLFEPELVSPLQASRPTVAEAPITTTTWNSLSILMGFVILHRDVRDPPVRLSNEESRVSLVAKGIGRPWYPEDDPIVSRHVFLQSGAAC